MNKPFENQQTNNSQHSKDKSLYHILSNSSIYSKLFETCSLLIIHNDGLNKVHLASRDPLATIRSPSFSPPPPSDTPPAGPLHRDELSLRRSLLRPCYGRRRPERRPACCPPRAPRRPRAWASPLALTRAAAPILFRVTRTSARQLDLDRA